MAKAKKKEVHKIICPHCKKSFNISAGEYDAILQQVKNNEFDKELKAKQKMREIRHSDNTVWVTPANLKSYDIHGAFNALKCIDWHYANSIKNVKKGDIVYIYVGQPECAIRYKCEVTKINIHCLEIDDSKYNKNLNEKGKTFFELKLIKKFDKDLLSLEELRKNGVKRNIQGPQRLYKETIEFIERNENR